MRYIIKGKFKFYSPQMHHSQQDAMGHEIMKQDRPKTAESRGPRQRFEIGGEGPKAKPISRGLEKIPTKILQSIKLAQCARHFQHWSVNNYHVIPFLHQQRLFANFQINTNYMQKPNPKCWSESVFQPFSLSFWKFELYREGADELHIVVMVNFLVSNITEDLQKLKLAKQFWFELVWLVFLFYLLTSINLILSLVPPPVWRCVPLVSSRLPSVRSPRPRGVQAGSSVPVRGQRLWQLIRNGSHLWLI